MGRLAHRIYISTLVLIVVLVIVTLFIKGTSYYQTSLEERFYHTDHKWWKPSGLIGHGLGIVGTLLIVIGVFGYMIRKRSKRLARIGLIKHWLEFHIFLCVLGPIMIVAHTTFKFGGLVSVSFWSMLAVVMSGVIGRFIYIQIPRTIEGRELSLQEVKDIKNQIGDQVRNSEFLEGNRKIAIANYGDYPTKGQNILLNAINKFTFEKTVLRDIRKRLGANKIERSERIKIIRLVKDEMALNRRIARLLTMQKLFKYWHVAHLPFAIVMLVIMLIHVAVTLAFGNFWIF